MKRHLMRVAIVCITSATAMAGSEQPTLKQTRKALPQSKPSHSRCYVMLSGTLIPQPCERLGSEPSTAIPMNIIGTLPPKIRGR